MDGPRGVCERTTHKGVGVIKYRPMELSLATPRLDDLTYQPVLCQLLRGFLESPQIIPHLMITGPPGIGKRTAVLAWMVQYDERWGSVTQLEMPRLPTRRNLVVRFTRGLYTMGIRVSSWDLHMHHILGAILEEQLLPKMDTGQSQRLVVILWDADWLSPAAQALLRSSISHMHHVSFWFISEMPQQLPTLQRECLVFRCPASVPPVPFELPVGIYDIEGSIREVVQSMLRPEQWQTTTHAHDNVRTLRKCVYLWFSTGWQPQLILRELTRAVLTLPISKKDALNIAVLTSQRQRLGNKCFVHWESFLMQILASLPWTKHPVPAPLGPSPSG